MPRPRQAIRKLRIAEMVIRGDRALLVANKYGISPQRVAQICIEVVGDLSKEHKEIPLISASGIKSARKHKDLILVAIKHKLVKL